MHICHKPLDGVSLASEGGVRESYDEARKRWGPTATVMVGWWRMEQAEVLLDHGKKSDEFQRVLKETVVLTDSHICSQC